MTLAEAFGAGALCGVLALIGLEALGVRLIWRAVTHPSHETHGR